MQAERARSQERVYQLQDVLVVGQVAFIAALQQEKGLALSHQGVCLGIWLITFGAEHG